MKRNQILTVAAVVAVGISGAVAVAANVGIMNAADNKNVGNVSAAGDLLPSNTQVVDVYLDGSGNTVPATGQEFAVDAAGSVTVSSGPGTIRLEQVNPTAGWSWSLTQTDAASLLVTFTDGSRTLEFTATADANGNITANVSEPTVVAAPTNQGGNNGGGEHEDDDDEYEGGGDDD